MKKILCTLILLVASCSTPPTATQIAQWKAAAQTAIVVLQTAEKITVAQAADLSKLVETGDLKGSTVVLEALAKAGKITPAEARAILSLLELVATTVVN